jgi:hypothetical protein
VIPGHPEKNCYQGFEYVIKDEVFYKENVYKWFCNPQLWTRDKIKLVEIIFEKEGNVM